MRCPSKPETGHSVAHYTRDFFLRPSCWPRGVEGLISETASITIASLGLRPRLIPVVKMPVPSGFREDENVARFPGAAFVIIAMWIHQTGHGSPVDRLRNFFDRMAPPVEGAVRPL